MQFLVWSMNVRQTVHLIYLCIYIHIAALDPSTHKFTLNQAPPIEFLAFSLVAILIVLNSCISLTFVPELQLLFILEGTKPQ